MDSLIVYHFSRRDNSAQTSTEGLSISHPSNLDETIKKMNQPALVTCQRILVFVPQEEDSEFFQQLESQNLKFDRLVGQEMYHFVLEVICGLKSSVLGETEIQGQFREFVKSHQKEAHSWIHRWASLFQNWLTDSKEIRQNHLKDLGSHSYGSLTRKILKETSIVQVIGAGQLVQEIEPWLSEKHLQIYSRKNQIPTFNKKSKAPRESFGLRDLVHRQKSEAVVIAAPISNQELADLLSESGHDIHHVIDWRGEYEFKSSDIQKMKIHKYFSFSQLTEQLSEEKKVMQQKLLPAMADIQKKSEQFFMKAIVRPMGWDDLCA